MTYLTESGDRYYKDDSWNGSILDNIVLNDDEIKILSESDVVFVHFWASCLSQVIELKKHMALSLWWILMYIEILLIWNALLRMLISL